MEFRSEPDANERASQKIWLFLSLVAASKAWLYWLTLYPDIRFNDVIFAWVTFHNFFILLIKFPVVKKMEFLHVIFIYKVFSEMLHTSKKNICMVKTTIQVDTEDEYDFFIMLLLMNPIIYFLKGNLHFQGHILIPRHSSCHWTLKYF